MNTQKHTGLNRRQFLAASAGTAAAASLGRFASAAIGNDTPSFALKPLPFAEDALEPIITADTLSFHYDKHHRGYVNNVNRLIKDTPYATMTLMEMVRASAEKSDIGLFNNAAQVWNHNFYWKSITPGGHKMPATLRAKIIADFGSIEACKKTLADVSVSQFASGWGWLAADRDRRLKVVSTSNAGLPQTDGLTPLLTIDVWEHAYYLDYQNRRGDHVNDVIEKLLNWEFAAENLFGKQQDDRV